METLTLRQHEILNTLQQYVEGIDSPMSVVERLDMDSFHTWCAEGSEHDSQKMIASLLLKALKSRMNDESVNDHIYLKEYEISQIQLFNILIEKFPLVKYSQMIANEAIVNTIGDSAEATIIDIGIGQGAQIVNILSLCRQLPNLKKLKIIGIEPFEDSLKKAGENIKAFSQELDFEVEFQSIYSFAEKFDFSIFKGISENLIVNASLSLHHIQDSRKRDKTLASIRSVNPKAFLLIEPNVNNMEENLQKRFVNCYNHYYDVFRIIDRIDISENDQNALKQFFGREIDDIIGKDDSDRYERHEPVNRWIDRLAHAGFSLNKQVLHTPVESEAGVTIRPQQEGYMGFISEQQMMLAVMYAS